MISMVRRCCRNSLSGGGPRSQGSPWGSVRSPQPMLWKWLIRWFTANLQHISMENIRKLWTSVNHKIVGVFLAFSAQCRHHRLRLQFLFLPPSGLICRSGPTGTAGTEISQSWTTGCEGCEGLLWGLPPLPCPTGPTAPTGPTFFNEWCWRLKVSVPWGSTRTWRWLNIEDFHGFFIFLEEQLKIINHSCHS